MKRTLHCERAGWAVTTKVALREQLELFVVCVAGDRAGGTDAAPGIAGETEVDSLTDVATGVSTVRK